MVIRRMKKYWILLFIKGKLDEIMVRYIIYFVE